MFSNFVSVFNPAPYPTSAFACPAPLSLSRYFSRTLNKRTYERTLTRVLFFVFPFFFFCPPPLFFSFFLYFLVRFWLRHSPCSMYFVKPTVVPITSARVQPAPDLVASSMKLIRLVPGSRCRHTNFTSRRQLER